MQLKWNSRSVLSSNSYKKSSYSHEQLQGA